MVFTAILWVRQHFFHPSAAFFFDESCFLFKLKKRERIFFSFCCSKWSLPQSVLSYSLSNESFSFHLSRSLLSASWLLLLFLHDSLAWPLLRLTMRRGWRERIWEEAKDELCCSSSSRLPGKRENAVKIMIKHVANDSAMHIPVLENGDKREHDPKDHKDQIMEERERRLWVQEGGKSSQSPKARRQW